MCSSDAALLPVRASTLQLRSSHGRLARLQLVCRTLRSVMARGLWVGLRTLSVGRAVPFVPNCGCKREDDEHQATLGAVRPDE